MSPAVAWLVGIFTAAQPTPSEAEAPADRARRIVTIANAIVAETRSHEEAALVARTLWEESGGLRRDVHDGRRKGDWGRAICLGQVHPQLRVPYKEWATLAGVDYAATRRCVAASVRLYRAMAERCDRKGDGAETKLARRAAAYATGRTCEASGWVGARPRARHALVWLRSAPPEPSRCMRNCRYALVEWAALPAVASITL